MKNLTDYIESGILEQYALGELSVAERAEVEDLCRREPAVQQELDQISAALGFYAEAHAVTPPAGMRERVLGKALAAIQAQPAAAPTMTASVNPTAAPAPESAVRPLYPEALERPGRSWWSIAASVALLLSLAGNYVLYNRWQHTHDDLLAAQNEQARFAATNQVMNRELSGSRQMLAVLRSDEFRPIALAGTKDAPSARARVLYNPATKAVYLDVHSLPALPPDKQYQLWALDNGKPVDAGMLARETAAGDSLQPMKSIASAQAFAMTVEPAGGSASPTMPIQAMGAVQI